MTLTQKRILSDDRWEAAWRRLEAAGKVNVPPEPREPYCPSSCTALHEWSVNPGASRNIRVVLQIPGGGSTGGGE